MVEAVETVTRAVKTIVYETPDGYITLEQTGRSQSYVVWKHGAVTASRRSTFGLGLNNAFERAKTALEKLAPPAKENPPSGSAVRMYRDFHQYEPKKIGAFSSSFFIPGSVCLAGTAVNVMYRSGKKDPSTLVKPKRPIDYIHDHDAGVKVYRTDQSCGGPFHRVPEYIRKAQELVLLGECLGFVYDDGQDCIEASPTNPYPELYTIPSGKALLVVQSKKKVLALIWGGRLGVEARGIVH